MRHGPKCSCETCTVYFDSQAKIQHVRSSLRAMQAQVDETVAQVGDGEDIYLYDPQGRAAIMEGLTVMRAVVVDAAKTLAEAEAVFDLIPRPPENPPRVRKPKPLVCEQLRSHGECRCVKGTKNWLCFVPCPWCGYNVNTSNPGNWCASCYCLFWVDEKRSVVHFGKSMPKSQAVAWAIAIAKGGGMRIARLSVDGAVDPE